MQTNGTLKTVIFLFFIAGVFFSCKHENRKAVLPAIQLLSVENGDTFSTGSIPKGKPFVLYYFDPDCSYCQDMTKHIIEEISIYQNFDFYYVSDQPDDKLAVFHKYFNLGDYQNISIYKDLNDGIKQFLVPNTIPYLCIFNKEKELEVVYAGGTDCENLIAELSSLDKT